MADHGKHTNTHTSCIHICVHTHIHIPIKVTDLGAPVLCCDFSHYPSVQMRENEVWGCSQQDATPLLPLSFIYLTSPAGCWDR